MFVFIISTLSLRYSSLAGQPFFALLDRASRRTTSNAVTMAAAASSASNLFRSILRAHRQHLPADMRALGDVYVKQEFRLHKKAKPEQATAFMHEWAHYLDQLTMTARAKESLRVGAIDNQVFEFGKELPHDVELSADQLQQLEKLRDEASKARK